MTDLLDRKTTALIAGACLVLTTGCLQKDVTETWYVDANGAVTWVVREDNVRSDAQAASDQRTEENEYWLAVQQGRHEMYQGFQDLRGERLRTVVLRPEVPYSVQTEARFPRLDELGQRMIAAIGATGTSLIRRDQGRWEWTFVVRDPSSFGSATEPSSGVTALFDGLDHLGVVLVQGRFEEAEGFQLSGDRRAARFNYKEADSKSDQPTVTLKLVWK